MAEIIPITDPNVEARVKIAISDLEEFYPDRKVHHLESLHKGLGTRLSKLYVTIGYESREAFINAYGFETVNTGGRPTTLDAEAILTELISRYDGIQKPTSIKILIHENPDLKRQLKTLQNKCTELYGTTPAKLLAERGIIEGGQSTPAMSKEELTAALEGMRETCAQDRELARTRAELLRMHPDFSDVLQALDANARLYYGETTVGLLKSHGVLKEGKPKMSADEGFDVLGELVDAMSVLPYGERPRKLGDASNIDPELLTRAQAALKSKAFTIADLKSYGVIRAGDEAMRKNGIRKADVSQIARSVAKLLGTTLVTPGDELRALLPAHCAGVDLENLVELRAITICIDGSEADGLDEGAEIKLSKREAISGFGQTYTEFKLATTPPHVVQTRACGRMTKDSFAAAASPLDEYVKGTVVNATHVKNEPFIQVRLTFTAPLRPLTLACILRAKGLLTKEDIAGDLTWRYRLEKAVR